MNKLNEDDIMKNVVNSAFRYTLLEILVPILYVVNYLDKRFLVYNLSDTMNEGLIKETNFQELSDLIFSRATIHQVFNCSEGVWRYIRTPKIKVLPIKDSKPYLPSSQFVITDDTLNVVDLRAIRIELLKKAEMLNIDDSMVEYENMLVSVDTIGIGNPPRTSNIIEFSLT